MQARVLAEENCRLQQSQTHSGALVQQLQGEVNQWRTTSQAFAHENQHLKRRLAQCEVWSHQCCWVQLSGVLVLDQQVLLSILCPLKAV